MSPRQAFPHPHQKESMVGYRSKSYSGGQIQIEPYHGASSDARPNGFRSYSVSYTSSSFSSHYEAAPPAAPPQKLKKGKSARSWSFKDPELQRKGRVAGYKVYTVEGKVKWSVRKSFRWLKDRYTRVVDGWW